MEEEIIGDHLHLKNQLQTMKNLLRKKEKRLNKYNRVLRAKHHVHTKIQDQYFHNNELYIAEPSKEKEIIDGKMKDKKGVKFQDPKSDFINDKYVPESVERLSPPLHMRSLIGEGGQERNQEVSLESTQVLQTVSNDFECKDSSNVKLKLNTPILKRNVNRCCMKQRPIKKLFDYNSPNASSSDKIESSSGKSQFSTNLNDVALNSSTPLENNMDYSTEFNLLKYKSLADKDVWCNSTENLMICENIKESKFNIDTQPKPANNFCGTELYTETLLEEIDIKNYTLLSTSISYVPSGNIMAMLLFKEIFSVWTFSKDEKLLKNSKKLLWHKVYQHNNSLFENAVPSGLCLFGGMSANPYFMIVKPPLDGGKTLSCTYIEFQSEDNIKIIKKKLPVAACSECTVIACSLSYWSFSLCVPGCKNVSCVSSCSNRDLYIISFDIKLSQKRGVWELELEFLKKVKSNEMPLTSLNCLSYFERDFSTPSERELLLWQDTSGRLGISDFEYRIWSTIFDTEFGLEKELANWSLIYGAAVKDILLLIFRVEGKLKFVAVNPVTLQFDIFYEANLSFLDMTKIGRCSTIFYEDKFMILTSDADIIYVDVKT